MDALDLIAQGKVKRYFRATKKLNSPHIVSHITQRAAGKEPMFLEDGDYLCMLGLLKEISQDYELNIYAFCLMPNHIHLLLAPTKQNLSDAMRGLFSRYAMNFNRKYERKGHLFGGPYRQALCFDDNYLLAASIYIHLNPVKASLVKDPVDYRWSSISLYLDENPPKSFIDPYFILDLLSDSDGTGSEIYGRMLSRSAELNIGQVFEQEDAVEQFRMKLKSLFPRRFERMNKERKIADSSGIDLLLPEEIDRRIEEMKRHAMFNSPESRQAKKYLIQQLIARGFNREDIGRRLGISRKTVYNILKSRE